MKAKFIFENYPPGAANDPNAPWNQCEDSSWIDFEMKDWNPRLITKSYCGEDDIEILENRSIDLMNLDRALLNKLGLNDRELESLDMAEDFFIEEYYQKGNTVYFETTAGNTELSISEIQDLK
jgi:hypothetical protein